MPNLRTTYMGIPLKSPLVVAACSLSTMVERIQRAEAAGAGALVIGSLFEEQIKMKQTGKLSEPTLSAYDLRWAQKNFRTLDSEAARAHLMWVKKTRELVDMPLIASLNGATPGFWMLYAGALAQTGVDALELNVYSIPTDPTRSGTQIEEDLYSILENVKSVVDIPVAIKLSPAYTSVAHVVNQLDERGADGIVMFNRFMQPEIDIDSLALDTEIHLSRPEESRVPLRWTAILYNRIKADIALTTGVHTGQDAVKALLGGAQVVQVASTLYLNGMAYLKTMNDDITTWMKTQKFKSIGEFRGILSQQHISDPQAFERAQYVQSLLNS